MALRTAEELMTLDWACAGSPFVDIAAKSAIDLSTLDVALQGSPFYGPSVGAEPPEPPVIDVQPVLLVVM